MRIYHIYKFLNYFVIHFHHELREGEGESSNKLMQRNLNFGFLVAQFFFIFEMMSNAWIITNMRTRIRHVLSQRISSN